MAMTAQVKAELASTPVTKACCRKAEVASTLRFAGGLHIVGGRIVVEAELDTGAAARRRTWLQIADLGRLAPLRIVSEGPSGAYAAGFLPALLGVPDSEVTPTGNELVET